MKITKLTDYAILLLCEMKFGELISAKQLSEKVNIPFATVNKLLRLLTAVNICFSKGGKLGGFGLSRKHSEISLMDILLSIDDININFTACTNTEAKCQLKKSCKISVKMNLINDEIHDTLRKRYLSDLF